MSAADRRARERLQRERALLDAATALMDRDDWEAVTVEEIARRAEYAKGTVYRHFASKDDLYVGSSPTGRAGTYRALDALDADRPFEAVLREAVAVCWQRATADRVHARLLPPCPASPTFSPPSRRTPATRSTRHEARIGDSLAGLVELGIEEGAVPAAEPEPRLFALSALLAGALALGPRPGRRRIPAGASRRRGAGDPRRPSYRVRAGSRRR